MASVSLAPYRDALYSAVVSDCCDQIGLRTASSRDALHPVGEPAVIIGWARTAHVAAVAAAPDPPYGREIAYLDSLRPEDVAVVECDSDAAAFLGELFSVASRSRGAVGAVVDGLVRDRRAIAELGFPVYARGARPTDSLGRMSIDAIDGDVEIAGMTVRSGDLVVADLDGVVAVPREHAADVLERALEKTRTENRARDALAGGATLAEAWERFRVL